MSQYEGRFKDAPWYNQSAEEKVLIIGAGGIGGNTCYCLAKSTQVQIFIQDFDKVEAINVGCQFFTTDQINKFKVAAIADTMYNHNKSINTIVNKFDSIVTSITICAVDNMATRKLAFEKWKQLSSAELFVDGRLRANLYEVYAVTKGQEEEYEKTLFNDDEVDEGPCTFKQTTYFGMLIGARITQIVINYLTNKYSSDPICNVPFKVSEFGEPFSIEVI